MAWELFESKGFTDTTMAEIAEAAGLSRRSIFNYFPTKEALLFPITDESLFLDEFEARLLKRPTSEKLVESMLAVLAEMAPLSVQLSRQYSPGPAVMQARQTESAIAHARNFWARQMEQIALSKLGNDPNAETKAGFIGALTGQVLSELGSLLKSNGGKLNPAQAIPQVVRSLQELFG